MKIFIIVITTADTKNTHLFYSLVLQMINNLSIFIGGDMATTRRYLDMASGASSTLTNNDIPITPINVNCLDPLGRSALLIGFDIKTKVFLFLYWTILFLFY
jgi:hypothetical protein